MLEPILTIIIAIIIGAISSLITMNLSLRRYHSERWWDRKVDVYMAVIEALHHSKAYSDENLNALIKDREISEEREKELRTRTSKANDEIQKAMDLGSFLLSEEAMERLNSYKKEESKASEEGDWFGYLNADFEATASCLNDMVKIAKRDLRPDSKLFSWLRISGKT